MGSLKTADDKPVTFARAVYEHHSCGVPSVCPADVLVHAAERILYPDGFSWGYEPSIDRQDAVDILRAAWLRVRDGGTR